MRFSRTMNKLSFYAVLFALLGLVLQTGHAAPQPPAKKSELNRIMAQIGETMLDIYPLVVAQRKLMRREIDKVTRSVDRLATLFQSAEPFIRAKADGYQVSYEFITEYLQIVQNILDTSHIDEARSYLYALGEICASCHTQDTMPRTLFDKSRRSYFLNDYAFAEFNFITRNYDAAVEYYEKFLDSKAIRTELQIIQPLQRALTVFVQVRNRPDSGIAFLKKYEALAQQTPETRDQINQWMTGLKTLKASGVSKSEQFNFTSLQGYVEKFMGSSSDISLSSPVAGDDEVIRVWLRGRLYHYLSGQAKADEIPMLLYWLSVIDRSIAYNFYFSLADLYLKQCVLNYPKHPYAKHCFNEYKAFVKHNYENKVPKGIRQEMDRLEKALKS